MIPQEIMARHLIEALAAKDTTVSPAQMLQLAKSSGQPMQLFGAAVQQLQDLGAIVPNTSNDAVFLSTKGERIADSFRGLSADQTKQLEQDAALRILQAIAAGEHPGTIRPAHIGVARRNGIISSLTTHQYVEHLHQGRAYRLTEHGKTTLQICTPAA